MPRLLPRLLLRLASTPLERRVGVEHRTRRGRRRECLGRHVPVRPSFSPTGRNASILLDPENPILNPARYSRHKAPSPRVRVPHVQQQGPEQGSHAHRRAMDAQERDWWASPYLRMLSSPLRMCIVTSRYLPSDFMIRLAPMLLPSVHHASSAQSLLPDGLEHPRFKTRKSGHASYVVCWKQVVEHLAERGTYKRLSPTVSMHSRLTQQIGHLLRVRVLQELEFLADQLQTRPLGAKNHPVLRRLTRREFRLMRTTGVIPDKSAVAVLVVPPLNRDPITGIRTSASSSSAFDGGLNDKTPRHHRSHLPPSVIYATTHPANNQIDVPALPHSQVPLYNGVSLFPSRPQRAAMHALLLRLLSIERRACGGEGRHNPLLPQDSAVKHSGDDRKPSHAFLLRSDGETALRADAAATAIALWRVRMWEGSGWDGNVTDEGRWVQS